MPPGYEAALKANNLPRKMHTYLGARHVFYNNSTLRYDEAAATVAWGMHNRVP